MGSFLSVLTHSLFRYLPFSIWSNAYRTVDDRSKNHSACRSKNEKKLTAYQSKIDGLKQDQIVYVTIIRNIKKLNLN